MDDPDLRALRACLDGDREAFARHFAPLVSGVVRDPDLAQEVFAALFADDCRRLRRFDPAKGSAAAWIGMIARQTAAERHRKPSLRTVSLEEVPAPSPSVDGLDALRLALDALPAREALCLALLFQDGLGAPETASILGVRRQAVYEIRERALEKLRKTLGKP